MTSKFQDDGDDVRPPLAAAYPAARVSHCSLARARV